MSPFDTFILFRNIRRERLKNWLSEFLRKVKRLGKEKGIRVELVEARGIGRIIKAYQ